MITLNNLIPLLPRNEGCVFYFGADMKKCLEFTDKYQMVFPNEKIIENNKYSFRTNNIYIRKYPCNMIVDVDWMIYNSCSIDLLIYDAPLFLSEEFIKIYQNELIIKVKQFIVLKYVFNRSTNNV